VVDLSPLAAMLQLALPGRDDWGTVRQPGCALKLPDRNPPTKKTGIFWREIAMDVAL